MVAELNAIPILCVLNAFFDVIFMLLINENIFFTKLVSAFYVIPKSFLTGPVKKTFRVASWLSSILENLPLTFSLT